MTGSGNPAKFGSKMGILKRSFQVLWSYSVLSTRAGQAAVFRPAESAQVLRLSTGRRRKDQGRSSWCPVQSNLVPCVHQAFYHIRAVDPHSFFCWCVFSCFSQCGSGSSLNEFVNNHLWRVFWSWKSQKGLLKSKKPWSWSKLTLKMLIKIKLLWSGYLRVRYQFPCTFSVFFSSLIYLLDPRIRIYFYSPGSYEQFS